MKFIVKLFMGLQVGMYRLTKGKLGGNMGKFKVLILTTKGRRSGKIFSNPVGYFERDGGYLIVASKRGAPTNPAWFVNMAKNPDKVWLEVGNRKFRAKVNSLQGKEREDGLARVAAVAPRYGEYQVKTDREIPVIRLTPAE